MSLHHKTNFVFIKGNLTEARYQHEVLDTEVIPLLRNHRGLQMLHESAPAHLARATTAYLNANNVNVVDFPPKSPDLNIIENIWDELNRPVRKTEAIPITLYQMRAKRGFNATLSYLAFMKFFRRVKKHVSVLAFILYFTIS